MALKISVKTIREAGLEARWTKTRFGRPIIVARRSGDKKWLAITVTMWNRAEVVGIAEAFEECTLTSNFFSVPI